MTAKTAPATAKPASTLCIFLTLTKQRIVIKKMRHAATAESSIATTAASSSAFKDSFPSGSTVSGKVDVVLDFSFMYDLRFDMATSTNVFTIKVMDVNGKEETTQVKFKR